MSYENQLVGAIYLAKLRMAQGCSWHSATEEAAEEYDVSLCDVQAAIEEAKSIFEREKKL